MLWHLWASARPDGHVPRTWVSHEEGALPLLRRPDSRGLHGVRSYLWHGRNCCSARYHSGGNSDFVSCNSFPDWGRQYCGIHSDSGQQRKVSSKAQMSSHRSVLRILLENEYASCFRIDSSELSVHEEGRTGCNDGNSR